MSGFVDRARTVRWPKTGERVEGRLVNKDGDPVYGEWFRCYFDPGDEGEASGDAGYRRRRQSTLISRPRDVKGGAVAVLATDVLEIQSGRMGRLVMEVVGAPRPLGKRRARVIEMTLGKTNRALST